MLHYQVTNSSGRRCRHRHRSAEAAFRCLRALRDFRCSLCGSTKRCRHGESNIIWNAVWHCAYVEQVVPGSPYIYTRV